MLDNDLSDVKVGDKLFNIITGTWQEVSYVGGTPTYPVGLNGLFYTFNGKSSKRDFLPIIYKKIPDWYPYPPREREIDPYKLPRGLKIEVANENTGYWGKRELIYFNDDCSPVCLVSGDSYSENYASTAWYKWRLPEGTEILEEWYKDI